MKQALVRRVPNGLYRTYYGLTKAYIKGESRDEVPFMFAVIEAVVEADGIVFQHPIRACPICGKPLTTTYGAVYHILARHGDWLDMVVLKACELHTMAKQYLRPNGKEWRCTACGARFNNAKEAIKHILAHHII